MKQNERILWLQRDEDYRTSGATAVECPEGSVCLHTG